MVFRLEFKRDLLQEKKYLENGVCTYALQGKIFYKTLKTDGSSLVYSQNRDDLPARMFIRGKELEKESYLPLFEVFDKMGISTRENSLVLMVSRQDLLITHSAMEGIQVFFLGIINEDGFIPACVLYDNDPTSFEENDIFSAIGYGESDKVYIPKRIENEEELKWIIENHGSFVSTEEGIPTTIFDKNMGRVFEMFSDTQNNLQLFIRLFFVVPFEEDSGGSRNVAEIEGRLEKISSYSPRDKIGEFVVFIERFKEFLQFFTTSKVCYGLVNHTSKVYFAYDEEDEKEARYMEKSLKSLKTMTKNIKLTLKKNKAKGEKGEKGEKSSSLQTQTREAIFDFFNYKKNINNCCHILKNFEAMRVD